MLAGTPMLVTSHLLWAGYVHFPGCSFGGAEDISDVKDQLKEAKWFRSSVTASTV